MPAQSTSLVVTDRAARYGKQLVSHLGRHHGGEWSEADGTGWIDLADGRVAVTAGDAGLDLAITTETGDLDRLEDVVGRHLVRFGTADELRVQWSRAGGETGTAQG